MPCKKGVTLFVIISNIYVMKGYLVDRIVMIGNY